MSARRPPAPAVAPRRLVAAAALAAATVLGGGRLPAQGLALLRTPPPAASVGPCPAPTPVAAPTADQRAQARRLGETAAASLIGGELAEARDLLRRATALDPASADLTYRLGRTLEELGDAAGATAAYCRLRELDAPADARADAEQRLGALAASAAPAAASPGATFADGVTRFERGDLAGADASFTSVIAGSPDYAPAYYDRALTRLARGRDAEALADFDRYARLAPSAVNAELRRTQDVLRRGRFSPGAALAAGMLPGGAQLYTGRPARGLLVALVAAAGAYLVLDEQSEFRTRTALDPFGNPYTFPDPNPTITHPKRGLGLGVIATALVGGALEGYFHARGGRSAVDALRARVRASAATTSP